MKRTKQTETMVREANEYLRRNKIADEHNVLFTFICDFLLRHKMYHGFNYYKDGYIYSGDICIGIRPQLAGSGEPGEYDYLQIY